MNQFKQRRAIMECKAMMAAGSCPKSCRSWHPCRYTHKRHPDLCKEAMRAERR
jgi:hypothetical protein